MSIQQKRTAKIGLALSRIFKKNSTNAPKQLSATRDTRDTQQHDEFKSSHQRQQRSHMPSTYPALPSPLWRHPRLPTRRLARALAPHRTPAHNTRTQREHRNYTRGQGVQGAQSKRTHAGFMGVRKCAGSWEGYARMVSNVLTCAHRRLAAPHCAEKISGCPETHTCKRSVDAASKL